MKPRSRESTKKSDFPVDPFAISKYISRRKIDFMSGMISDCYIVYFGKSVRVNARHQSRREIENILERLRP